MIEVVIPPPMSKSQKRKAGTLRPFLGHEITRNDHQMIMSLLGFTTVPLGLKKNHIKSEETLWEITEKAFGVRRLPEEPFMDAVKRCRREIKKVPSSKRTEMRNKAFAEAARLSAMRAMADPQRQRDGRDRKRNRGCSERRDEFYKSWEWRTLRMQILKQYGAKCMCCGAVPGMLDEAGLPVQIVIDHIKPLSKYWHLRLEPTNLQCLCGSCNQGKGAWDETDYRPKTAEIIHFPTSRLELAGA